MSHLTVDQWWKRIEEHVSDWCQDPTDAWFWVHVTDHPSRPELPCRGIMYRVDTHTLCYQDLLAECQRHDALPDVLLDSTAMIVILLRFRRSHGHGTSQHLEIRYYDRLTCQPVMNTVTNSITVTDPIASPSSAMLRRRNSSS